MKLYGSITELVAAVFRKNSQAITLRPNQATTYTASRDIQTPPQDADSVLVSTTATQTLTNKTLTSPTITAPSLTGVTTLSLDDSDSAFNLVLLSTSTLTADRNLTIDVDDGARTLELGGNVTFAGAFATSGANSVTLTTTGSTSLTLPTSGTLATRAGTETLTNKTLDSSDTITGATAASFSNGGTITLPSGTLTLATLTGTETLTNKTITSPTISSPTVRTNLLLQNTAGSQPTLQLSEAPANGTNTVTLQSTANLSADYTLTLPVDAGSSGQVLTTNGSGVLTWSSVSSFSGSSTNNAIAKFNGTAGALQNSGITIDASNNVSGVVALTATGNLTVDSPTLFVNSSTHRVGVGSTSPVSKLYVLGTTDESQLQVRAFAGQTSDVFRAETSGGTAILEAGTTSVRWLGTATNDTADALYNGEYIENNGANGTSVSSGTALNVASVSLTAGDWDVHAKANFSNASFSSTTDFIIVSISSTSATLDQKTLILIPPGNSGARVGWAYKRVSLSATTTIYAVGQANFSLGTCTTDANNWITARRAR